MTWKGEKPQINTDKHRYVLFIRVNRCSSVVKSVQPYNPNLTELFYSGLNYPGDFSWLMFDFTMYSDLMSYAPSRREYNRYDNIGYYYDEMMRKGIYYTPYVVDFINGEGVFTQ